MATNKPTTQILQLQWVPLNCVAVYGGWRQIYLDQSGCSGTCSNAKLGHSKLKEKQDDESLLVPIPEPLSVGGGDRKYSY